MTILRVQMGFPMDSALPEDVITVNPHFSSPDPAALLAALKANLIAWAPVGVKPFTLKAYDAEKAPPSYPLAIASQGGTPASGASPREIALCLSYYSTYNRPRYRGRLFLPYNLLSGGAPSLRPGTTQRNLVIDFAKLVLSKALPASTNWVVWSTVDRKAYGVTDAWCDDEWDTVRSRGLAPTTRTTATIP